MPDLSPRNLSSIRQKSPQIGEALADVTAAINNVGQQTNASPVGQTPSPSPHASLSVQGGQGYFAATISDNSPAFRGKEHFLEVSENPQFAQGSVHKIALGPSMSWYGQLGSKMLHFRSYSAHPTTGPSAPIYAMNVDGSSGTPPTIKGNASADGFGHAPYTTPTVPKR